MAADTNSWIGSEDRRRGRRLVIAVAAAFVAFGSTGWQAAAQAAAPGATSARAATAAQVSPPPLSVFSCLGHCQTYTVSPSVDSVRMVSEGAQGGNGWSGSGGFGGEDQAVVAVTP